MNFTNDLFISSDNGFTTEAFTVNSTSFIPEAFPVNSTSFIPEAFPVNSTSFIPEAFPVNSTSFIPEAFPVNSTSFTTEAFTVNSTSFIPEAFPVNITSFITEAFPVNITSFITEAFTDSTTEYYYDYPDEDFGRCVYERHGAHFLPPLYAIFFLLGLLGNSLVIWVIACGVRLRSMTDVCLLNLAIADLLLVCSLPFLAHQARDEWLFGDVMCRVVLGIYHIVFYCGIFFVCLMSIDRYLAIVHAVYALKARTRSFGMIAAAITWVAGIFASFPEVIFLKQQTSANMSQYCFPAYPSTSDDRSHFWRVFGLLKMNIVGLLVPLSIIIFCYSQIVWRLLYSHSSKKQAIRVVFVVVAVFFCCWVPYNIASFFKVLDLQLIYTGCERSKSIRLALQVTEAIAYSHSCLNPILYVFVGEKFRRQLLRLINRASCRLCQVIKVYIPQDMITASVYSQPTSMDERSTGV